MNKQIPNKIAIKIYNILVEHAGMYDCDSNKEPFLYHQNEKVSKYNRDGGCREYRFQGALGFGGKFYNCNNRFYVTAYNEDIGDKQQKIIDTVNALLIPIYDEFLSLNK